MVPDTLKCVRFPKWGVGAPATGGRAGRATVLSGGGRPWPVCVRLRRLVLSSSASSLEAPAVSFDFFFLVSVGLG